MIQFAPCLAAIGGTDRCLCLLEVGHYGPHVCANCGASWHKELGLEWPGPGGAETRRARLRTFYPLQKK